MEFSSIGRALSAPSVLVQARRPAAAPGDWKAQLKSKLRTTQHERPRDFDELIDAYVRTSTKGRGYSTNLDRLIGMCLRLSEVEVLKQILANEVMESMSIDCAVDARGWETLIAAMPPGFPLRALNLSIVRFDATGLDLLREVLCGMPKLEQLSLYMVSVDGPVSSGWLYGRALEALEAVHLVTNSNPKEGDGALLLEMLRHCQLRELIVLDDGAITADQHGLLAEALGRQHLLSSLKLIVGKSSNAPKRLDDYLPLLCGPASFAAVALGGWALEASDFNRLLAALRNKPALASLSLCNFKFLKGAGSESFQLSSLAYIPGLVELDLSWNSFEDEEMVQLLHAFKVEQTCIKLLGLNGKSIGPGTIAATAALLNVNTTLREVRLQFASGQSPASWDDEATLALTKAVEANTWLQQLLVRPSDIPPDYWLRIVESLKRNRHSPLVNGMWAALNSAHRGFPKDAAKVVFEQGLTEFDAIRLSSVNKAAWEEFRRVRGPSK